MNAFFESQGANITKEQMAALGITGYNEFYGKHILVFNDNTPSLYNVIQPGINNNNNLQYNKVNLTQSVDTNTNSTSFVPNGEVEHIVEVSKFPTIDDLKTGTIITQLESTSNKGISDVAKISGNFDETHKKFTVIDVEFKPDNEYQTGGKKNKRNNRLTKRRTKKTRKTKRRRNIHKK